MVMLPGNRGVNLTEYKTPARRETIRPRGIDVDSVHLAVEVTNTKALVAEGWKRDWAPKSEEPAAMNSPDLADWTICHVYDSDGGSAELREKVKV